MDTSQLELDIETVTLKASDQKITLKDTKNTINDDHDQNCSKEIDDEKNGSKDWAHYFCKTNTFIHYLFGQTKGETIFNLLYNKYVVIFICMLACFNIMMTYVFGNHSSIALYSAYVTYCSCAFYASFIILTINKKAFSMIIKSFSFWFKFIYALKFGIIYAMYYYIYAADEWNVSLVWLIANGFGALSWILLVTMYSFLDGFCINQKIKICVGVIFSIVTTYEAFKYTFHSDDAIMQFSSDFSISLTGIMGSSLQVLAIFFWRQTVLSIIKTDQCILIQHSPYIKWK